MVWRPSWLGGSETDPDKDEQAKKDKKAFDDAVAAAVKVQTDPIMDRLKGLDAISSFVTDAKKEKEEREAREAEAARVRAQAEADKNKPTDEDLAELMKTDPAKAVAYINKNNTELLLRTSANQVKASVFHDRADDFPYYTGEIKAEIDRILSEQPLQFQNSVSGIENTYYTVVGKRQKEINEGKIKSRFASSTSTTQGTSSNSDSEVKIEVTDEIRKAARLSGIPIDDYMKLVQQQVKDGAIDYV